MLIFLLKFLTLLNKAMNYYCIGAEACMYKVNGASVVFSPPLSYGHGIRGH